MFVFLPDDPYYCGLRARVPNFVKSSKSKENNNNSNVTNNNSSNGKDNSAAAVSKRLSIAHLQHPSSLQSLHQLHQMHPHHNLMAAHQHHQQLMWHARSYESGIGKLATLARTSNLQRFIRVIQVVLPLQIPTSLSHPIVTCTAVYRCRRGATFRHRVPCTSANGIRSGRAGFRLKINKKSN